MLIHDCKPGMPIRWPTRNALGTIKYVVGGWVTIVWSTGPQKGNELKYQRSVAEFELSDPHWESAALLQNLGAAVKAGMAAKHTQDNKKEEMRFFSSVSQGHCACGIVRKQCSYHA